MMHATPPLTHLGCATQLASAELRVAFPRVFVPAVLEFAVLSLVPVEDLHEKTTHTSAALLETQALVCSVFAKQGMTFVRYV